MATIPVLGSVEVFALEKERMIQVKTEWGLGFMLTTDEALALGGGLILLCKHGPWGDLTKKRKRK